MKLTPKRPPSEPPPPPLPKSPPPTSPSIKTPSELDLIFDESSDLVHIETNAGTNANKTVPIDSPEDEYLEPNRPVMCSIEEHLKRHNSSSTISSHCTSLSRDESVEGNANEETYEIVNDSDAQPVMVEERPRLPKPKEPQINNKSMSIGNVLANLQNRTSRDKKTKDKVDVDSNLVDNSFASLSMDAINNNNLFGNQLIECH